MRSNVLYVIGNGFDLRHKIKSSFQDFKNYAELQNRELFEIIEKYLPVKDDWSDIESSLAEIDSASVMDELGHFLSVYGSADWSESSHHDFQYEVDRIVQCLSTDLQVMIGRWIGTMKILTPSTKRNRLKTIDTNATYLTFNYTSTLEELYSVPSSNILHIHGEARLQAKELILGHSRNSANRRNPKEWRNERDIDPRFLEACKSIDTYFSTTFKPSTHLIRSNKAFFKQLDAIKTIYVLGHSLSDVDAPYFSELLKQPNIASARWYVACRCKEEKPEKLALLEAMGLDQSQISTVLWVDI